MIIEEHLTVRDIELMVKKEKKKKEIKRKTISQDLQTELSHFKENINSHYSFKEPVKITSNKIIITVQDLKEIKLINRIINGENDE